MIKNFNDFVNEKFKDGNHIYSLGDMYNDDFDYKGMLNMGQKASVKMGLKKLQKLQDSFTDVNYYNSCPSLFKAINFLENDDISNAEKALIDFNKECLIQSKELIEFFKIEENSNPLNFKTFSISFEIPLKEEEELSEIQKKNLAKKNAKLLNYNGGNYEITKVHTNFGKFIKVELEGSFRLTDMYRNSEFSRDGEIEHFKNTVFTKQLVLDKCASIFNAKPTNIKIQLFK